MIGRFSPAVVFVIAAIASIFLVSPVYKTNDKYAEESISRLGQLPDEFFQALTFEFKGVAADLLLLKTISFIGLKIGENKIPSPEEWQRIHDMLDRVTDLDGRFWDPYLLAETMLAWQAGMIKEANQLLTKASQNRPEDYRPLYFIGFNYFYFLNDSENAAVYLRQAAQITGSPSYLKGLASRLSVYGNQTKLGIVFLENLLQDTNDKKVRPYLEKRLTALKSIYYLEQKVIEYREAYKRLPESLDQLVELGFLDSIPVDPYGGAFVIMKNGRVFTTSKLVVGTD